MPKRPASEKTGTFRIKSLHMNNKLLLVGFLISLANSGYAQSKPGSIEYLVPSFYKPVPEKVKDTTLRFECYDRQFKVINPVTDFEQVYYYSLLKYYTDSTNTYKDATGKKQFLPVTKIIKRYDRIGTSDKWMSISYPSNKYIELLSDKNAIISTDTITGNNTISIYHFYKAEPLKR